MLDAVHVRFTIAGELGEFDEDAFAAALATALGVPRAAISLTLAAASVLVTATITATDMAAGTLLSEVEALAADTAVASDALGVTIEAVSPPVLTQVLTPAERGETPSTGIVVGASAAGGAAALLLGLWLYRRRAHATRTRTGPGELKKAAENEHAPARKVVREVVATPSVSSVLGASAP